MYIITLLTEDESVELQYMSKKDWRKSILFVCSFNFIFHHKTDILFVVVYNQWNQWSSFLHKE